MNDIQKLVELLPDLRALADQLPALEELAAGASAEVKDKIKPIEEFPVHSRRRSEIPAQVIDHIWVKAQANSRKDADDYWRVSVKRVTSKEGTTEVGDAFDVLLLRQVTIVTGDTLPAILSYFPSTGDHPDKWIGLVGPCVDGFWAKLAFASLAPAFVELERNATTVKAGGRTGNATEVNGVGDIPADTVVWVWPVTGATPAEYRFEYEPRIGTAVTPAAMLPADFEQYAIAEDEWDRASPPAETDGVKVRVQMRMVYDHEAETPTLWAIYREFTYDSLGSLKTISLEHRVSIDVTEACP